MRTIQQILTEHECVPHVTMDEDELRRLIREVRNDERKSNELAFEHIEDYRNYGAKNETDHTFQLGWSMARLTKSKLKACLAN